MAADKYWQYEKEYYTIVKEHDFVIRVIEHEDVTRTEDGITVTKSEPCKVHEFKVKRDALIKSGEYFRKLFAYDSPTEAGQNTIDLKEDSAAGIVVWFKMFHDTIDDTTYQASISDIWQLLETAHKYGFDPKSKVATAWFAKWYDVQTTNHERSFDYKDHSMLLFPCHTFDHAQGFRAATKYMVYRATGHIVERRPVDFKHEHLRLDPNILQQLNAAKGRLKTILHRALYTPIDQLLKLARCNCKAQVLYAYEQGLTNTGAWPLESGFLSNSVDRILKYLEDFPRPGAFIPQTCGANFCSFDFAYVVGNAKMECRRYFDGLCLDCMDASHPKLGDADEDYWKHSKLGVHWDQGCRIRHGQPSWYFSFLGRRMKMIEWVASSKRNQNSSGQGGDVSLQNLSLQ